MSLIANIYVMSAFNNINTREFSMKNIERKLKWEFRIRISNKVWTLIRDNDCVETYAEVQEPIYHQVCEAVRDLVLLEINSQAEIEELINE